MRENEFSWKNAKGLELYAKTWQPDGAARGSVALVHGLGEHIGRYEHVAEALTGAGYAMIGVDLPGHGRSGGTRGHAAFEEMTADIDHLLEEASSRWPGKPRFLYGHSMGGAITLFYTLTCRPDVEGVIVTSPGLAAGQPVPSWKKLMAKVMGRLAPSMTLDNGLDMDNLSNDPAVVAAYKADPLVHAKISTRLGLDLLSRGAWMMEQAENWPVALLLVQGTGDHIVSPAATEAFASRIPAHLLTYKVWEGLYHETHNEPEKDQVLRYMLDWIERTAGTSSK